MSQMKGELGKHHRGSDSKRRKSEKKTRLSKSSSKEAKRIKIDRQSSTSKKETRVPNVEEKLSPLEGEPMVEERLVVEDRPMVEEEIVEASHSPAMIILDDSNGSPSAGPIVPLPMDEELHLEGVGSPKTPSAHGVELLPPAEEAREVGGEAEAQKELPVKVLPPKESGGVEGEAETSRRNEKIEQKPIDQEGLLDEEEIQSADSLMEVSGGKGKQAETSRVEAS